MSRTVARISVLTAAIATLPENRQVRFLSRMDNFVNLDDLTMLWATAASLDRDKR